MANGNEEGPRGYLLVDGQVIESREFVTVKDKEDIAPATPNKTPEEESREVYSDMLSMVFGIEIPPEDLLPDLESEKNAGEISPNSVNES